MKVVLHVLRSCAVTAAWLLPVLMLCSSLGLLGLSHKQRRRP